jgi:hypothetical protein
MLTRWPIAMLLLPLVSCGVQDPHVGSGPITLSPNVKASFEEYKARDAPIYFVVTESGLGSFYVYCEGGFNCTGSSARLHALDQCRRSHPDEECKVYAMGRRVVWREADEEGPAPASQLSAGDRLVRDCLEGDTPVMRIEQCSRAIASADVAQSEKRGPYYVRARAFELVGNELEAEQDYRAVLRIDPDHSAAKARLDQLIAPAAGAATSYDTLEPTVPE